MSKQSFDNGQPLDWDSLKDIFPWLQECKCRETYSLEPHGNGYALYLGRCPHRHGYNIANITEPDLPRLEVVVKYLNLYLTHFKE